MFEKLKGDRLFHKLMKRPDIDKAYAMVPPTDSWYDTITKVHDSLAQIRQLPHETLSITSHDGLTLKAIYYPSEGAKETVIFVHGYTSHAEREWAFPGLFYHTLGYNVLIPYQRAHGISEGKYISFGALEHKDMMQWVEKVNELMPGGSMVIHGLSMGGGIVLDLATKEMQGVKCLISDAPSESIQLFFRYVTADVYKKDWQKVLPFVLARFRKEFGVDAEAFERAENIANCRYPLLLSAGELEDREPFFRKLQEVCPTDTTVLLLPGCNHGNGLYKQTELYQNSIRQFLAEHM